MATTVFAHAFFGVDHQHSGFSASCARNHVLEELNMPWGVDDDVIAFRRLEETPRGVDGDALILLVF